MALRVQVGWKAYRKSVKLPEVPSNPNGSPYVNILSDRSVQDNLPDQEDEEL